VLFSEAANKGTHFIQLCNRQNIPLIFLQNTTGFMVGSAYEKDGIIKHGAKLINAVSNSDVPTITILIGSSFGAGNYAMNGRAYQPRFLFSYPNAQIAVMGPEQLSGVMLMIQKQAAEQAGIPFDEENAKEIAAYMMLQVKKNSSAWYASAQGWDDGIIDPRDTRTVLSICLAVVYNQEFKGSENFGVFRM
jgi:acetyl-CoA carboxylase carboxyltransferase component